MISLDQTVREEIRRRGRVPFAEFMAWALTHPRGGYYTTGPGRTGRSGDFLTNVQVPLYAELLAHQFCEMWDALGSQRFTLVELGGNDGALAEGIFRELESRGRHRSASLHLIEASPAARVAARKRLSRYPHVHLHASLEDLEHIAGVEGCVYSNEFFDALPVHRVRRIGDRLTELYVTEKEGRLVEDPGDPSTPQLAAALAQSGVLLADGQEGEVCLAAGDVLAGVGRILARGFLWTADYGGSAAEVYAPHRVRGTLRSFSKHQLAESPLEAVGERDITAHVDFTRLARLGAAEGFRPLVYADQGPYWIAAGEAVLKKAVEDLSEGGRRGREVRQLVHPGAFGGAFRILIQGKNVEGIGLRAEIAARLQRLGAGDLVVRG